MFGENELVVNSLTRIHAKLHKQHTVLSFHRVYEASASKHVDFNCIPGAINPADILSEHWGCTSVWPMLQPQMHWQGDTMDLYEK